MAAISWKKGVNGNWTTASDWSTDTVPGVADDPSLSAPGVYTVTSDASVKGATLEIAAGNFIALSVRDLASPPGKSTWPTAQASRSTPTMSTTPERSS